MEDQPYMLLEDDSKGDQLLQFPSNSKKAKSSSKIPLSSVAVQDQFMRREKNMGLLQSQCSLHWTGVFYQRKGHLRLKPCSGYVKPKELLGILGGADSGAKELMEIISQRIDPSVTDVYLQGHVLLNKLPPGRLFRRFVAYVPRSENHLAFLTVRETLMFSAQMRLPSHAKYQEIKAMVDLTLDWLGLTGSHSCEDTYIGNDVVKGVSGGQKRRVSVGVELVAGAAVLLMDKPTNGLDAQTAYDLVNRTKRVCTKGGKAVVMNVASPSPELLGLFTNICLLSKGYMVYWGPPEGLEKYFNQQGYIKPKTKSLPSFIEDMLSKPSKYLTEEKKQLGKSNRRLIKELARFFKRTSESKKILDMEISRAMEAELDTSSEELDESEQAEEHRLIKQFSTVLDERGLQGDIWKLPKKIKWWQQFKLIMKRRRTTKLRGKQMILSRLVPIIIVGLMIGILFYQLTQEQVRERVSMVYFAVGFMGFGTVAFIPDIMVQDRPTFYYQYEADYFSPSAWYLVQFLMDMPQCFIEAFSFSIITYWMSGFVAQWVPFLVYLLIMFWIRFTSFSLAMLTMSVFQVPATAQVFATTFFPIVLAYCGFCRPIKFQDIGNGFYDFFLNIVNIAGIFTWPYRALSAQEVFEVAKTNHKLSDQGDYLDYWGCYAPPGDTARFLYYSGVTEAFSEGSEIMFLTQLRLGSCTDQNSTGLAWSPYAPDTAGSVVFQATEHIWVSFLQLSLWAIILNLCAFRNFKYKNVSRKAPDPGVKKKEERVAKVQFQRVQEESEQVAGAYVQFAHIDCFVDTPAGEKQILRDTNGFVMPGDMIALMGPSGAGKSTLLDVLANKKRGGRLDIAQQLFNGRDRDANFNRMAGYCEQFNSHMACLTVREALEFACELRLDDSIPKIQKDLIVDQTLDELELFELADKTIGDQFDGISSEAAKKLTIAVELVMRPTLLFLDEPTTGLDSAAAITVMQLVQKLSKKGMSVICTIHQPPAEAFAVFNKILLLQSGGTMVFFGDCKDLNGWFVKEAKLNDMVPGKNPADWAIEALKLYDTQTVWNNSPECAELNRTLQNIICGQNYGQKFDSPYASSFWCMYKTTLSRAVKFYLRNHENIIARISAALVQSFCLGILYFNVKEANEDYQSVMFQSIFDVVTVLMTESAAEEVPLIFSERSTFYREIDSKFFRVLPYFLARVTAQQIMALCQAVCFATPLFWMAFYNYPLFHDAEGYPVDGEVSPYPIRIADYFYFIWQLWLVINAAMAFSQFFASISPQEGIGNVYYTNLCALCELFAGFIIYLSSVGIAGTSSPKDGCANLQLQECWETETNNNAFVQYWGRIINLFDLFKYSLYSLGSFFINCTYMGGVDQETYEKNLIWKEFTNDLNVTSQLGLWMPHYQIPWSQRCSDDSLGQTSWERWQYMWGLIFFAVLYNIGVYIFLAFKRWDKR